MEHLLLGRSRRVVGVGAGVDIFRTESEPEWLKIRPLRSPDDKGRGRGQDKLEDMMEDKIQAGQEESQHMVDGLAQGWAKGRSEIKTWRRATQSATNRTGQRV